MAQKLIEAFSEMIFIHGFIHADPHPGYARIPRHTHIVHPLSHLPFLSPVHSNILVRRGPRGKPELILLDHGLYRELSDSFRASFCRFWRSLVMQDKAGMIKYGREVGAGDKGELLASMFSGMRGGGQYALVGPTNGHRHRHTSADTHRLRHRHTHERADRDPYSAALTALSGSV